MLAYDYPLLQLFWVILWIQLVIAWLMILFGVIVDIFRNRELGGVAKVLWLVLTVFAPVVGVIAYVLVHGGRIASRLGEGADAVPPPPPGYGDQQKVVA